MKRRDLEKELERDIQEHIDLETRDNIDRGMSPEQGRSAALRKFGNIARVKESTREIWGWIWLGQFAHDCRYGLRILRKNPVFTAVATLSLALGIGGNTAVFSVFNGLFLGSLPFPEPERLVYLHESGPLWKMSDLKITPTDFASWSLGNQTFQNMALFQENGASLAGADETMRIKGVTVSHELAATLGIKPIRGRDLLAGEDRPGHAKVMLLGYALWQRRFGGREDVVGRVLQIDDEPYTVVGILPATAVFPASGDYWIPETIDPGNQRARAWDGVGRLKPGVTPEQARADLMRIHKSLIAASPANKVTQPELVALRDRYLGTYRPVVQVLMAVVGFVLLIACANVAGLLMSRGHARAREMAVRAALGAGKRRLIQQALAESLLLATAGGAIGVVLGWLGLRALLASQPEFLPGWVKFHLDARLTLFALAVTGGATLLASLGPALAFSRLDMRGALAEAALKSSLSRGRRLGMNALVVGEIAAALLLLTGGGLVLRAFQKVLRADPGFAVGNVLTFALNPPYNGKDQRLRFYESVLDGLRSTPGVTAAGATTFLPFDDPFPGGSFYRAEGGPAIPFAQVPLVAMRCVTPGYFGALGIAIRAGREFDDRERGATPPAAVVNQAFARHYWPSDTAPVGRRFAIIGTSEWITVMGVVGDVRHDSLDRDVRPWVYRPCYQSDFVPVQMHFAVRGSAGPGSLLAAARKIVRRADPGLAVFDAYTMQELIDRSLWARRAYTWLFGVFAAVALVMAVAGIYGVTSYAVVQRTREIGIRMALGAKPIDVIAQVLREALLLLTAGVAIGTLAAWYGTRLMQTLLAGVSPHDSFTFVAIVAILAAAALSANLIPALRAASIDPVRALRFE